MFNLRQNNKGFTLIELLVVIAIIGMLSSVVLASLNTARSKARDAVRLAEINQLQLALEFYYDANGRYPASSACGATSPNSGWCNSVQSLSGNHWIRHNGTTNVLAPYMGSEPTDPNQGSSPNWTPLNGGTYFYYSAVDNGQWYMIIFGLENYPHQMEAQDGVSACTGGPYHYGSGNNGILTVGVSC